MKILDRLQNATKIFLDSAPVIYYVEKDARYLSRVDAAFDLIDSGKPEAVTSPVTLAECVVMPLRNSRADLVEAFNDVILKGDNVTFAVIDEAIAGKAADFRARYNLSLTDAFQVAVAVAASCDAFLTNDIALKRVKEINVIVLDDVDAG